MEKQPGLFTDRNDIVLAEFLRDRKWLLTKCSLAMLAVTLIMVSIGGGWQVVLIVFLLDTAVWREYYLLARRVREGSFGQDEHDTELLTQYFAARGIRVENMCLD